MSILKVAQLGHPILRKIAAKVPVDNIQSPEHQRLIDDMIETMREYDGVGLAAPQVHVSLQIAVMEIHENPRYPGQPEIPVTVFINPVITPMTEEEMEVWEGCLSVRGLRGAVRRPKKIHLLAFDRDGNTIDRVYEGFPAIAIQHETDHLFGKVFLDRMKDLSKLAFIEEFQKYHLKHDDVIADE